MSNRLEKNTNITVIPGSPGMPGSPGQPYTPPRVYFTYEEKVDYVPVTVWQAMMSPTYGALPETFEANKPLSDGSTASSAAWQAWVNEQPKGDSLKVPVTQLVPITYLVAKRHVVPEIPYIPPTPPVPATAEQVIKEFNQGWNSGAVSLAIANGNVVYTFTPSPNATGIVSGIGTPNDPSIFEYTNIQFAWSILNFKAAPMELGVAKTAYTTLAVADALTIERVGGTIRYLINSTEIYQSEIKSYGPVWVDASLYVGGDAIINASLTSTEGGSAYGELQPLRASAAAGFEAYCDTLLAPLVGEAYGYQPAVVNAQFRPLQGFAGDILFYADSRGEFPALTGHSSGGLLAPSFAYSVGYLVPLEGMAVGEGRATVRCETEMRPVAGLSGVGSYGESQGVMPRMWGFSGTYYAYDGVLFGFIPWFTFRAQGRGDETALIADIPAFTLAADSAGRMEAEAPAFTFAATGNDPSFDVLAGEMPAFTLDALGLTGSLGDLVADYPETFVMTALGGDTLAGEAPGFTCAASGITGSVAVLAAQIPAFFSTAAGLTEAFGALAAQMPSFVMLYGELTGELPLFVSSASDITTAPARRVWVTNLRVEEMTQYTQYDFIAVGRLGGALYGLKADGLYLLEGQDDNGAQIASRFVTAPNKFGTEHHKRVPYLYLGNARGIEVIPTVDGNAIGTYDAIDGRQRVRLARGADGVYWSFEVRSLLGQPVKVDGFEPLIEKLARRV